MYTIFGYDCILLQSVQHSSAFSMIKTLKACVDTWKIIYHFKWGLISVLSNYYIRTCKSHEENKSKIEQERSSMQQAHNQCHRPTPWMQESVCMHKSPTQIRHSRMNQTWS